MDLDYYKDRLRDLLRKNGQRPDEAQFRCLMDEWVSTPPSDRPAGWPDMVAETLTIVAGNPRDPDQCAHFARLLSVVDAAGANLHAAAHGEGLVDKAAMTGQFGILKYLVGRGVAIDPANASPDQTPLLHATHGAHEEVARYLIENGARTDGRNAFQQTPVHLACRHLMGETLDLLLAAGADPLAVDDLGRNGLHILAVEATEPGGKDLALARRLLVAGLDPHEPDKRGHSAADLARDAGNRALFELLVDYPAELIARTTPPATRISSRRSL